MASAEYRARVAESLGRAGLTILQSGVDYDGHIAPDISMIDPDKNTVYLIATVDAADSGNPKNWLEKRDALTDCRSHVASMFDDPTHAAWAALVICRLGHYAENYGMQYEIPNAPHNVRRLVGVAVPTDDAPVLRHVLDSLSLTYREANLPGGVTFIAFNAANTDGITLLFQQAMAATIPDSEADMDGVGPTPVDDSFEEHSIRAQIESADVLIAAIARSVGKFVMGIPMALVAFPILLLELIIRMRIPPLVGYMTLAVIALLGGFEALYGSLYADVYASAINYSDTALISSGAVLAVIDVASFITSVLPGISDAIEKLGSLTANGVLALGAQSTLLRVVSAGVMLKWVLGIGFTMGIFAPLESVGRKIVTASVLIFFLLPGVVALQSYAYHTTIDRMVERIAVETQAAGGALGQTVKAAEGAYYNFRAWAAGIMGDSETKAELKREAEKRRDEVATYATTLTRLLVRLFIAVAFFLVIAPLAAYWLLFKLIVKAAQTDGTAILSR